MAQQTERAYIGSGVAQTPRLKDERAMTAGPPNPRVSGSETLDATRNVFDLLFDGTTNYIEFPDVVFDPATRYQISVEWQTTDASDGAGGGVTQAFGLFCSQPADGTANYHTHYAGHNGTAGVHRAWNDGVNGSVNSTVVGDVWHLAPAGTWITSRLTATPSGSVDNSQATWYQSADPLGTLGSVNFTVGSGTLATAKFRVGGDSLVTADVAPANYFPPGRIRNIEIRRGGGNGVLIHAWYVDEGFGSIIYDRINRTEGYIQGTPTWVDTIPVVPV
jgi:hypothetical protein